MVGEVKEAKPASEEKALREKALTLGVPIVLGADSETIAWTALRDFKASINGVLLEFHKGDPIRDWDTINDL